VRTVQWQGLLQDVDWEIRSSARSHPARQLDGLLAFGAQRCAGYEFAWQLSTTDEWVTQRLDVRLVGLDHERPKLNRTLLLERSADRWQSRGWGEADDAALPAPGLGGSDQLAATLDVVIDSCPLSHWVPIRRLGLAGPRPPARRGGPSRPLAVALPVLRVRLPSLSVVLTRQRYVWVEDAGTGRVLRHSFAGGPQSTLTVDDQGVPIEFDGLSRRRDTALVA
jgi:hypothetical protein